MGGRLDFACGVLTRRNQVAGSPLKVHQMGHYVLSVVASIVAPRLGRGPKLVAPYFEWAFLGKRPDLSGGRLRLPLTEHG